MSLHLVALIDVKRGAGLGIKSASWPISIIERKDTLTINLLRVLVCFSGQVQLRKCLREAWENSLQIVPQNGAKGKGRRAKSRGQTSEVGGQKSEAGKAEGRKQEAESRRQTAGTALLHCCGLFEFQMSRMIFQSRPSRR